MCLFTLERNFIYNIFTHWLGSCQKHFDHDVRSCSDTHKATNPDSDPWKWPPRSYFVGSAESDLPASKPNDSYPGTESRISSGGAVGTGSSSPSKLVWAATEWPDSQRGCNSQHGATVTSSLGGGCSSVTAVRISNLHTGASC